MVHEFIAVRFSNTPLQPLHLTVNKLDDFAGLEANHMVVMPALIQFENRPTTLEIVPRNEARMLELPQHSIYGCEANFFTRIYQLAIDIFGS